MTVTAAKVHAERIWGAQRLIAVRRYHDGSIDVHLHPAGVASDTRARNYSFHALDAEGQPTCHDDCRALAAMAREAH